MRIAIVTFHSSQNYGAVLQCYALQTVLIEMGHDIEIIDRLFDKFNIPSYRFKRVKKVIFPNYFERFREKFLKLSEHINSQQDLYDIQNRYDVIITGSDQIWNPQLTNGFHDVYFCDFCFPKGKSRFIAYAPSMEISRLSTQEAEYLTRVLNCFDALSVRESSLIPILQPLVSQPIQQVLDPTLLLDATAWNPLIGKCPENRPYVVLYQVRENPAVRMKAFEIAQSIGGIVVELTARIDCHYSTKYQTASPADFVTYIRYATYVVTTSFHGTAFSLIFNRPFYTFSLGDNFDSRSASLLESVNLTERLVCPDEQFEISLIDFKQANKRLKHLRKQSCDFLRQSLHERQEQ